MKVLLPIFLIAVSLSAQTPKAKPPAPKPAVVQSSTGPNSPNLNNVQGNVVIPPTLQPPTSGVVPPPPPAPQLTATEQIAIATLVTQQGDLQKKIDQVFNEIYAAHPGYHFDGHVMMLVANPPPPTPPSPTPAAPSAEPKK